MKPDCSETRSLSYQVAEAVVGLSIAEAERSVEHKWGSPSCPIGDGRLESTDSTRDPMGARFGHRLAAADKTIAVVDRLEAWNMHVVGSSGGLAEPIHRSHGVAVATKDVVVWVAVAVAVATKDAVVEVGVGVGVATKDTMVAVAVAPGLDTQVAAGST